ncbi:MAG: hypothetical protein CMO12_02275 [Thaumarchaeota archaeon]|nr:hypothetical protein [Nitrososphaerota archaeon]
MGRTVIIPIIPPVAREFGASDVTIGGLVAGFGLSRVILDLPIGAIVQKARPKRMMLISILLILFSAIIGGTASNITTLFIARFIEGAGSSLFFITELSVIGRLTTPKHRGRTMSLVSSLIEIGFLLGPALGGVAATIGGIRAPFLVYSIIAVIAIVGLQLNRGLPTEPEETGLEVTINLEIFKKLLTDKNMVIVNLATFALFLGRTGVMFTAIPIFAYDNLAVSELLLGGILTIGAIPAFLLLIPSGYLSDRYGRKPMVMLALLSSAVTIALIPRAGSFEQFTFFIILYGATTGLIGPTPAWFLDVTPTHLRGAAMGMYRFFNDLGLATGPLMVGLLLQMSRTDRVQSLPFDVSAMVLIVFGLLLLKARDPVGELRKRERKEKQEQAL